MQLSMLDSLRRMVVTRRSVRELVVIHPVDELGIVRELREIATWIDMKKKVDTSSTVS